MDDPNVDDALLTATDRAREAAEQFQEMPIESPELVPEARKVEHRIEDVSVLAEDAAEQAGE